MVHQPAPTRPLFAYVSLFTSLGTLVCCALPSVLVLFGLGATVASVLSAAPWLVTLSRHKQWVFFAAGALIGADFVYVYRLSPRLRGSLESCSLENQSACLRAERVSRAVLWASTGIYIVGCFTAYVLGPLLLRFG